jgi:TonB-dependent receptor
MIAFPFGLNLTSRALVLALLAGFALSADGAYAQEASAPGRISGRILEASTGRPLAGASVVIVGTSNGAQAREDGRFTIAPVPAGTVSLLVRRLGFQPKTITDVIVSAGRTTEQSVSLEEGVIQFETTVVTASAERGTVHEALSQQRDAVGIVNSMTAEQISRSPDGDAAAAVQRVSGVTVQEGKFVFVRGLGERYTTASLNGSRIPSPEPEKKTVPLDLFPSSLLRTITTSKTFTPDQPGDFSGAQVDLQTREFPARRMISYSVSTGANSASTGRSILASPMATSEWLGFASGNRRLPSMVRDAGNFGSRNYTQNEVNQMIGSFRNSWTPFTRSGHPNSSFGMTVGGNDPIMGRTVGYVGSLTYSLSQDVREDEYRALIDFGTGNSPANEFRGSTGRTGVQWGGLLNMSTFVGAADRLSFNNTYSRSADAEAHMDRGRDENLGMQNILERSTLSYVERTVRSNQLAGQHLRGVNTLDWSLTNTSVSRSEPDRADMVYISSPDPSTGAAMPFTLFTASNDGARRTFADLTEGSWNASLDFRREFGETLQPSSFKVGGLFRLTSRDAEVLQYAISGMTQLSGDELSRPAEEIFDGRHTIGDTRTFTLAPLGQSGSYGAQDRLLAAYAMSDYAFNDRYRIVGGARLEHSDVEVMTENLFGQRQPVNRVFTDVLPAAALNVFLTDAQNLRISVSQTLARPEYRELSPILNRDVLGGQGFRGDTALVRTLIRNADIRWEWYPNPGEILSVAFFAKHFSKPIERVEVPTSGTSVLSFINAEGATNFGVELEARKGLGRVAEILAPLSVFSNVTVMQSQIRLGSSAAASATNANRPMVGQAPYVVNAGVTWMSEGGSVSATTLYNVVGKRISAAGPSPLPDIYEMPRQMLDVSLRFPTFAGVEGKLDMKNLLDAPHVLSQGAVTRSRYSSGRTLSAGLSWRP